MGRGSKVVPGATGVAAIRPALPRICSRHTIKAGKIHGSRADRTRPGTPRSPNLHPGFARKPQRHAQGGTEGRLSTVWSYPAPSDVGSLSSRHEGCAPSGASQICERYGKAPGRPWASATPAGGSTRRACERGCSCWARPSKATPRQQSGSHLRGLVCRGPRQRCTSSVETGHGCSWRRSFGTSAPSHGSSSSLYGTSAWLGCHLLLGMSMLSCPKWMP